MMKHRNGIVFTHVRVSFSVCTEQANWVLEIIPSEKIIKSIPVVHSIRPSRETAICQWSHAMSISSIWGIYFQNSFIINTH